MTASVALPAGAVAAAARQVPGERSGERTDREERLREQRIPVKEPAKGEPVMQRGRCSKRKPIFPQLFNSMTDGQNFRCRLKNLKYEGGHFVTDNSFSGDSNALARGHDAQMS